MAQRMAVALIVLAGITALMVTLFRATGFDDPCARSMCDWPTTESTTLLP
jgi:hypothetical protein